MPRRGIIPTDPKQCQCGKWFNRHTSRRPYESLAAYHKRRFCGQVCAMKYANNVRCWKPTPEEVLAAKEAVWKRLGWWSDGMVARELGISNAPFSRWINKQRSNPQATFMTLYERGRTHSTTRRVYSHDHPKTLPQPSLEELEAERALILKENGQEELLALHPRIFDTPPWEQRRNKGGAA